MADSSLEALFARMRELEARIAALEKKANHQEKEEEGIKVRGYRKNTWATINLLHNKEYFSKRQAAIRLGVTEATAYKLTKKWEGQGKLHIFRRDLGGKVDFCPVSEIEALVPTIHEGKSYEEGDSYEP